MPLLRTLVLLVTATVLTGCYQSHVSLLAGRELAAPYSRITYRETGSADEQIVLTRRGASYDGDDGSSLRLFETEPGWYVVEVGNRNDDGNEEFLYGYLNVDTATSTAKLYVAVADGHAELLASSADPPVKLAGAHDCGDATCIDDVDSYASMAHAAVAAGFGPDTTYEFKGEP